MIQKMEIHKILGKKKKREREQNQKESIFTHGSLSLCRYAQNTERDPERGANHVAG